MKQFKNSIASILCTLALLSCSDQFYNTPHVGNIYVYTKAYASAAHKAYIGKEEIGRIDSLGKIFDSKGKYIGRTQYERITKGDIKVGVNVWAAQNGELRTFDSVSIGAINAKGKVFDKEGKKIGKRVASTKELFDYFEKNEDYDQRNF